MNSSLLSTFRAVCAAGSVLILIASASAQAPSTADLVSQLSNPEPYEQIAAAKQLGRTAHGDVEVAKALIAHAFDEDPSVRAACVSALIQIEAPRELVLPIWLKTLQGKDHDSITHVIATIGTMGPKVLPFIRETLKDPKAAFWAVLVAEQLGPDAADAAPEILALFNSTQPELQMHAVMAAGSIQGDPNTIVPALVSVLNSGTGLSSKYAACFSLAQYPPSPASISALKSAWENASDLELKLIAAWALLKLQPDSPQRSEYLQSLIAGLSNDEVRIRRMAVRGLTEIKPSAAGPSPEVMTAMARALQDADPEIISQIVDSLVARGTQCLGVCRNALGQKGLRNYAVQIAGRLGKVAAPLVPDMIPLLQGQDGTLAAETAYALATMGPDAHAATDALVAQLSSTNKQAAYAACYALGQIGPSAGPAAAEAIRQQVYSKDPFMQLSAAVALLQVNPQDPKALALAKPVLVGGMEHTNQFVRAQAVRELGALGPKAAEAKPKLESMQQDESKLVRDEVAKALKAIQ